MTKANSDQILDSFLSECLGDVTPTHFIADSLHQIDVSPEAAERFAEASRVARRDEGRSAKRHLSNPVTTRREARPIRIDSSRKLKGRTVPSATSFWSRSLYLLSGVAAGAVIAIGSWNFLVDNDDADFSLADSKSTGNQKTYSDPSSQSDEVSQPRVVLEKDLPAPEAMESVDSSLVPMIASKEFESSNNTEALSPPVLSPEVLPMDKLPFSAVNPKSKAPLNSPLNADEISPKSDIAANGGLEQGLLKSQELVSMINDQLDYMWKLRGVTPALQINDEQWIERASVRLTGRVVSPAEKGAFLADSASNRKENWLQKATSSDDFIKFWTNRFTNALLPKIEPEESAASVAQRTRFKQWVASRLQKSISMNQIVKEVLTASGSLVQSDADYSPQAYWWYQVANNNDHVRTADTIVSNLLGQRGTCIRCHESSTIALNDKDWNRSREVIGRSDYWNLASIVSGIQVTISESAELPKPKSDTSLSEVIDSASEEKITGIKIGYKKDLKPLFYEQPDRSLVAAAYKLPNGQILRSPAENKGADRKGSEKKTDQNSNSNELIRDNMEDLSLWVTSTPAFDERQVNWIWEVLIGQPLVSRFAMADSDGSIERQELLESLGSQFRRSDFDFAKLVSALVLTKAFDREVIQADPAWYITSTPEALAEYQMRQRLFASYAANMDPSLRSIGNVAQWFARTNSSVLGQSVPQQLKPNSPKPAISTDSRTAADSPPEVSAAQTQFVLRSRVLPDGLNSEVDRWLKSSMPWEALVDHAFYLSQDAAASKEEQSAARELLSSTRDRRQALQRILASQLP